MRLAFFTSIITDGEPKSGYEIANEAIVAGLRQLGHDVVVVGFKLPRQAAVADDNLIVLDERDLENATASLSTKLDWLRWALTKDLPFAAAKLASFSRSDLDRIIAQYGPFDAHILNSYQMPAAFPQLTATRFCYVAHNVEYRSALQNSESSKSRFERFMYQRDARLLKSLERTPCENSSYVWAF
ncbi:MAG: glycosyl transferase, partial [Rhizobiaceae bacterium]